MSGAKRAGLTALCLQIPTKWVPRPPKAARRPSKSCSADSREKYSASCTPEAGHAPLRPITRRVLRPG